MLCSEARLAANRANAQKSTGPRTPEGKTRSRANALKHGLCATIVVAEDAALVKERTEEYFYALKPQNEYQTWAVDQIAILSIRIDRSQRMERRLRDKVALRAELTWDDDRKLEAETLGGMLAKRPPEVVESLRRTPQGCEWLMSRWAMLAHAADTNPQGWTEGQTKLAFDLLATPLDFRDGRKPGALIDFEGVVLETADDPAVVARREVAELKRRREVVRDLDEVERALVEADMSDNADPELKRLRRYESAMHSRIRWFITQLNPKNVMDKPKHMLRPQWQEEVKPEPKSEDEKLAEAHPASSPHPPFCLTPDEFPEPGQKADIPAILSIRKQKRLEKAEARRAAQRRKVERLRSDSDTA